MEPTTYLLLSFFNKYLDDIRGKPNCHPNPEEQKSNTQAKVAMLCDEDKQDDNYPDIVITQEAIVVEVSSIL